MFISAHLPPAHTQKTQQLRGRAADRPTIMPADSDSAKLFGRQRDIHALLGGGKVADVLLWRNKRLSGMIFVGITAVWLLFAVAEYNFLTLLCYLSIAAMLVVFIWANIAALVGADPPEIPEQALSKEAFREVALAFHADLGHFLSFLHRIARGEDLKLFLMTIAALWIISVIGSCCSTLNLLYMGYLCAQTLPFLYEKYEDEVDQLVTQGGRDFQKLYGRVDAELLSRIPRGPRPPLKDKKIM